MAPAPARTAGRATESLAPTVPVLACFHEEQGWPNDLGYAVDEPFGFGDVEGTDVRREGGWLMLGAGNGVRITESRFGGLNPIPSRTWTASSRPITLDAWSRAAR